MVRIRLRRVGRKKQPSYRIVVADSRSPRDGRYIEVIGFYNPRTEPATMTLKEERALHWLSVGAQPSDPVRRILDKLGTLARYERLRQGESLEALVAEAEAEAAAREPVSPKTSRPPRPKAEKAAVQAIAEEPVEEAEAEEVADETAEEPVEEGEAEEAADEMAEEPAADESETVEEAADAE